ncbi:MAG: cysteine--tRNA ligase [Saprospiraceae bacterium]|nr:cysteine--tRNA ligase [Saprospiraceae bacterium]
MSELKKLFVYNSLTREKQEFKPIHEGKVGMYVCGPTVYNDVHLGNCRTFVNFDIIYRYLLHLGYKVRYVRNITDVGHLLDDGEDRMLKGARLDQLEPMEVAQKYTYGFREMMSIFNTLHPSIEPQATGHIPEQIEMVQQIIDNGYGYEANGSVYFDTLKFINENENVYGKLSGRVVNELLAESRENLKNQSEKRHPADFAIWMKATPEHIMRWNSPWSVGFPGWHLECSAMSTKYLGPTFDIHGGGGDLKFPHHENEIAQNVGSCRCQPANYWLHANMLLLNGKKMSKSDGNTISPLELFSGESSHVSKGYDPMVVRFFMLQAHYRSTLDITDEALQAAEKGYKRLMEANRSLSTISEEHLEQHKSTKLDTDINNLLDKAFDDLNDDFNCPKALSQLFELATIINSVKAAQLPLEDISSSTIKRLKLNFNQILFDIFGLKDISMASHNGASGSTNVVEGLMDLIIQLRKTARGNKDWTMSDQIRDALQPLGLQLKDGKEGTTWSIE